MNIRNAMQEVLQTESRHGWTSVVPDDNPALFCEKLLLVVSEISEALEEFRAGRGVSEIWFREEKGESKPEGVPIELADAVIRIFAFCEANHIDLEKALQLKMAYNEHRPWKHGGKRI